MSRAGNEPRHRPSRAERRAEKAEVDDPAVVLEAALRFLEARARSTAEVRRRLTSAGYRGELVDGAVERLTALGILDDEQFARAWVESRDRARPRGERALRRELALKGVDRGVSDEVLEERREAGEGTEVDLDAARRLLARNGRSLARVVDPRVRRQRAYALLARNGFDPDVCRRASVEVLDEVDDVD
ncbi:MAG TPA: regulatory protein RecX [Candidatus Limnocylindrales bacterium]|nr:regulatory protein RecX [Candidatus Limnocylindrales bacterium]